MARQAGTRGRGSPGPLRPGRTGRDRRGTAPAAPESVEEVFGRHRLQIQACGAHVRSGDRLLLRTGARIRALVSRSEARSRRRCHRPRNALQPISTGKVRRSRIVSTAPTKRSRPCPGTSTSCRRASHGQSHHQGASAARTCQALAVPVAGRGPESPGRDAGSLSRSS